MKQHTIVQDMVEYTVDRYGDDYYVVTETSYATKMPEPYFIPDATGKCDTCQRPDCRHGIILDSVLSNEQLESNLVNPVSH